MNAVAPLVVALGLLLLCLSTRALAQSERIRVFGDRMRHPQDPKEFIRTYVDMPKDHDGDTVPIAVGIQLSPGFVRGIEELPISWHYNLTLPVARAVTIAGDNTTVDNFYFPMLGYELPKLGGGLNFPAVGRNPFKFASATFNAYGHPPVGVFDFQHFDTRFFFEDQQWWWGEQFPPESFSDTVWPCAHGTVDAIFNSAQPVPEECWPGDPATTLNLGHYVWGQGVHVYNTLEQGFIEFTKGSSLGYVDSLVWGIQAGRVAYIETMFGRDKALQSNYRECYDLSATIPKHFVTERIVPTRKCLISDGGPTFKLQYDKFITVPGGCDDMKDSTLVGWFPPDLALYFYGPQCKVPVAPS